MSGPLNHDVSISAATRLFRVCVGLYPRRFRVGYGAEMAHAHDVTTDHGRRARAHRAEKSK